MATSTFDIVEAMAFRPVLLLASHMPLTKEGCCVAGILHGLTERVILRVEIVEVCRAAAAYLLRSLRALLVFLYLSDVSCCCGQSVTHRILSGQHAGTCRGAERISCVGVGEEHATCCEGIDMGCFVERAAVAGRIAPAEIVGHDQKDVGLLRCIFSAHELQGICCGKSCGDACCLHEFSTVHGLSFQFGKSPVHHRHSDELDASLVIHEIMGWDDGVSCLDVAI